MITPSAEVQFTVFNYMANRSAGMRSVTVRAMGAELPYDRHQIKVALSKLRKEGIVSKCGFEIEKGVRRNTFRLATDIKKKG